MNIHPTGIEQFFGEDEIIVSKTDPRGHITYANDVFLRIAGYTEREVLGKPHSILRHPDMPRSIYALLWKTIESGNEMFAYVMNLAKNGDHYWVLAHVTPTFDQTGKIVGYHSNRRVPERAGLAKIKTIYAELLAEERKWDSKTQQIAASSTLLRRVVEAHNMSYDELVFSL